MLSYYIVSYDITDQKRWNRVYKIMQGHGQRIQYSLFICVLSEKDIIKLDMKLRDVIKHDEDKVMIVELGPSDGFAKNRIKCLGVNTPLPIRQPIIV